MASGQALAAVAFAHLRRPGPPNPSATRLPGGWRLDGKLICVRCIEASGDRVVGLLVPAGASGQPLPAGFHLGMPLRLLAMGGTHTRPVRLEGVEVPACQVLFEEDFERWSAADALSVCRVSPMVFGCMRGAIADLHNAGTTHRDGDALALAQAFTRECRRLRHDAYSLIDASTGNGSGDFLLVQAQSAPSRQASLQLLRAGAGTGPWRSLRNWPRDLG